MDKFMRIVFLLLVLILIVHVYGQGITKIGTTAAGFLNIDIGACGCGMGSAFIAKSDDATGVYWNPAGLSLTKNIELNYTYSNFEPDLDFRFLSIIFLKKVWGTFNLNGTYFNMGKMERMTIDQPYGTGEYFEASSKALGFSYSYQIIQYISLGITSKYIEEKIYHSKADGFALDGGIICTIPFYSLRFGFSFSNYGTKLQMSGKDMLAQIDIDTSISGNNSNINAILKNDSYDLPRLIRFGMAFDLLDKVKSANYNIVFDGVKLKDEDLIFNLGYEFIFKEFLYIRNGYINFFEQNKYKRRSCYGIGLRFKIKDIIALKFDYANQDKEYSDDYKVYSFGLELLFMQNK